MRPLAAIHISAGLMAMVLIGLFWTSTVATELSGDVALIVMAKTMVLYAMPLLVLAMAATGASGMKLAGSSRAPVIVTKKRRMAVVAANGIGVLVPSAIFLAWRAGSGMFDTWFYAVQALELTAGAVNFTLLVANVRTGRRMTRGRRAARRK